MTSVKAKLKIVLQADDTVVAETEDPVLWQRVLSIINAPQSESASSRSDVLDSKGHRHVPPARETRGLHAVDGDAVDKFAHFLGVEREVVEGACSPSLEPPYLHLDAHCWEEMKKQLPSKGRGTIAPSAIAATLLALWFRVLGNVGNATQAQTLRILQTIGIEDKNASRALSGTEWLQSRPGGLVLVNPAQQSRAIAVARSFCTKQWKVSASATS